MPDHSHSPSAVKLAGVSRLYGRFLALRNLSLSIPFGASVVLLGENGAGKSTLLRVIAGLTSPTQGSVEVFGAEPREERHRIAYMSHSPMLYDELTGLENLKYFASLHHCINSDRAAGSPAASQALRDVGLDPALTRRIGEYSQGMRQRASLARVLLTSPELLLLDEPFSNLDLESAHAMIERLQRFVSEPTADGHARTLILTTHQADLARPLAQTTLHMKNGSIVEN